MGNSVFLLILFISSVIIKLSNKKDFWYEDYRFAKE